LWHEIFERVYNAADQSQKEQIIQWARQVEPKQLEISIWDRTRQSYRMSILAGRILKNRFIRGGVYFGIVATGVATVLATYWKYYQYPCFIKLSPSISAHIVTKILVGTLLGALTSVVFCLGLVTIDRV